MDLSPSSRRIGFVYLAYFFAAFGSALAIKGITVPGDPAATTTNILAHDTAFRAGHAIDIAANLIYITLAALFYGYFRPVNRTLSLLAAFFALVGCAVQLVSGLLQIAPLTLLPDNPAAALIALKLHGQSFHISLVLFAMYDLIIGWLVLKSNVLPRALGIVLMVAGAGWFTFIWPPLASELAPVVLPFGALAEIALMLWLIVKNPEAPH